MRTQEKKPSGIKKSLQRKGLFGEWVGAQPTEPLRPGKKVAFWTVQVWELSREAGVGLSIPNRKQ